MGILLELQARGELRAEDLAGTVEGSVRTIYRDVEALCETGVPVVATPGKGYRLLEGYFLPPLTFTADEAALLALRGEVGRDPGGSPPRPPARGRPAAAPRGRGRAGEAGRRAAARSRGGRRAAAPGAAVRLAGRPVEGTGEPV